MVHNKFEIYAHNMNNIGGVYMDKNKKEKHQKINFSEDKTKYGEYISSLFGWIPLSKQKERADELDKITKNNKNNEN